MLLLFVHFFKYPTGCACMKRHANGPQLHRLGDVVTITSNSHKISCSC
uniref:Uncharacterized protein n=1 Tax=Anguilla anguilla TaxID=7936 RepID=A0A0E9PFW0_ANGAN